MTVKDVLNAGQEYRVRHSGTWKNLTFVKTIDRMGSRLRTHYMFYNQETRRDVVIKSLMNVREIVITEAEKWEKNNG